LQLRFTRTAETSIRCEFTAAPHLAGAPGVLHGGIQATLLDEVLGATAHTAYGEHGSASMVTADFTLRYRRPVPVDAPIAVCGDLVRIDGRNHYVEGRIENAAGDVLTVAEARWCLIEPAE